MHYESRVSAQDLIDRVVARVNGFAITLTDVEAAVGLGLVNVPAGPGANAAAVPQLIDRQLVLLEVARFTPPEPDAVAVDDELASLTRHAGPRLQALMDAAGIEEAQIRQFARDNLRIQAYLNQRFGTNTQVSDEEVAAYYRTHPEEFTRSGSLMPFAEAEPVARQRAAAERRRATITQWMRDLRARADVTEPAR